MSTDTEAYVPDFAKYDIERADLASGGPATTFSLEMIDQAVVGSRQPMAWTVTGQDNPYLSDAYKKQLARDAWHDRAVASIQQAIAIRVKAMAGNTVVQLAYNIFQQACQAYAPHHLGGAPLLYRPVWAKLFEKEHPDWRYESEVLRGAGFVYFPVATGMKLWERLVKGVGDVKPFTRRGQGGEFEVAALMHEGAEVNVVRFRPDAKPYVESLIVLPGGKPGKPKKLILPNGVVARPAWGGA